MTSRACPIEPRPLGPDLHRHRLVFVAAAAWDDVLLTRPDLAAEPVVAAWSDRNWPLVVRRRGAGEEGGLPLGLPLPPSLGKRRLSVLMRDLDRVRDAPPPSLAAAMEVAPKSWKPVAARIIGLASDHGIEARVFGGLAWAFLTGMSYLGPASDLDLLLEVPADHDIAGLAAGLAAIEAQAPMRLDGEVVRPDGAAVNLREVHRGASELLVKTMRGVALRDRAWFLGGANRA